MKRKLLSIFLMLALVLSLSAFGLTAFADDTPTPKDEITNIDYENIGGGWGMGLAVKGFSVAGGYPHQGATMPGMDQYVVVTKADGSVFKPEATTNLAGKVGVPLNDPKVAGYDRQIASIKAHVPTDGTVLTDAEILEKAKANIGEGALKAESDAQKLAQKALDDAKAKLPRGEAKTEEQILKEFVEKNGEKADAMKKAFGEDVKALLEKKIPNKKLAGYIAGGAAILGVLGYAIAPKNKEV